jgi:Uma2 family endonuclease
LGEILIMPPNYTLSGSYESGILFQLELWTRSRRNGRVFGPSSGFVLPNGARRSPDAAWISTERIRSIPANEREKYWHIAPDLVIELKSRTDRLRQLHAKMREWIDNGSQLGWLIDPESRTVWVYSAGPVQELISPNVVEGDGLFAGLRLDLVEIWRGPTAE